MTIRCQHSPRVLRTSAPSCALVHGRPHAHHRPHCRVPLVRTSSHSSVLPASVPAAASPPELAPALTAGPEPPTLCVCNRRLPLHRDLQLPPAAEFVHTTSSSHYCCSLWSLLAAPEVLLRTPTPLQPLWTPTALTKDHAVSMLWTPIV